MAVTAATNDHVDLLNHAIQQARLAAGHLDPARAAAVAGGERAHPGDWVATRRNDRTLTTTAGHAVHNRDLWTVEQVHGDGALTVTHRHGHGTVTLPAEYTARHVRLGYAATGHGHQGDTVDVALTLVDGATTHRGLYVAATRGRHDNRLHVVTDTADPAEARDALEAVLARDRADIPAVTQRRHLAHQAPAAPFTPRAPTPHWLPDAVAALRERRDELQDRHDSYEHGRRQAAAELAGLQPALAAARAAWRPYAERIDAIDRDLEQKLLAGHVVRQPGRHARPLRAPPRHPPPSRPRHRRRRRRPHPHRRHRARRRPPSRNDSTRSPPGPRTSANGPPAVAPSPSSTSTTARTCNTPNASSTRSPPGNDGRNGRAVPANDLAASDRDARRRRPRRTRTPATTAPDSPGRTTRNSSVGVDSLRRQLGLENHIQHRPADIGRDGPELGL